MQEKFENLVSYQGAEIRKFILENIKDYIKIQNLDPVKLQETINNIKTLIDGNLSSVKSIMDLVEGNKNALERAKQELRDLILSSNTELSTSIRLELLGKMDVSNTALRAEIASVKKELSFRQEINVSALTNTFAKSLWNYSDFICTKDITVGSGEYSYRFKLSSDHFNPNAIAFDVGVGSPEVSIVLDGKELYKDKVLAVKFMNQYEYITIKTNEPFKSLKLTFITDAWEGGTDRNNDGMSEDRNLHVFEVTENGKVLDTLKGIMYGQGTMSLNR
jgi:hypothetical protein